MSKQYKLVVIVKSVGPDGEVLQEIQVEEYSNTPANHIEKNMTVAAHLMGAFGEMAAKAQTALAG